MQFHKFAIRTTLAIATVLSMQSVSTATTKYDFIIKQFGLKTEVPQAIQPEAKTESTAIRQAGQTFFSHPPTLIRATSFQIGANIPSTYEFTLTVPQDAGQPLKAVTITQVENVETVNFDVSNSKAYIGRQLTTSSGIRLASVGGNQPANLAEATIVFDRPVQPGNTVTIALAAENNPHQSGVYLFGVTAYPDGKNGLGQFLGYGRIHFYGR